MKTSYVYKIFLNIKHVLRHNLFMIYNVLFILILKYTLLFAIKYFRLYYCIWKY